MKVRRFRESDADRVSAIMTAAFKSFLKGKFSPALAHGLLPSVLAKGAHARDRFRETVSFVAEGEDGRVVGYLKAVAASDGLGTLEVVGVDPSSFGAGAGGALMQAAERFWRRKKQRKVHTCVSSHNTRALLYYIKHGFLPEGFQRDHFLRGVHEIPLGKYLS
jgi:ribosomal protein S18 acetylase RimI-like enzyme